MDDEHITIPHIIAILNALDNDPTEPFLLCTENKKKMIEMGICFLRPGGRDNQSISLDDLALYCALVCRQDIRGNNLDERCYTRVGVDGALYR